MGRGNKSTPFTYSAPVVTIWQNLNNTKGTRVDDEQPWSKLLDNLVANEVSWLWSPASFKDDKRGLIYVDKVYAIMLDFDGKAARSKKDMTAIYEDEAALLLGLTETLHITHRTKSDKNDGFPCFRILIPLPRAVDNEEYSLIVSHFIRLGSQINDKECSFCQGENDDCSCKLTTTIDTSTRDPSRAWYPPIAPQKWKAYTKSPWTQKPAKVMRLLTLERIIGDGKLQAIKDAEEAAKACASTNMEFSVEERAIRYLSQMEPSISGQGGDMALWRAALACRRFELGADDIEYLLLHHFNPRCEPPWDRYRIRRKAEQAANAPVKKSLIERT